MLARVPFFAAAVAWYADRRAPGARTSAIARTRLIDDVVSQALRDGIHQVVILGAGFDCRVYRLSDIRSAAVFEVDHPATVAAKLSRLRSLVAKCPADVRFVEIDFDRQNLAETLHRAGFDSGQPAIFVWEGVTNYLTASGVDAVLRYVAGCAGGSRMVFTYVHHGALDGSGRFPDAAKIMSNVAALGEPWTFGLIPEELPSYLRERGLRLNRDDGARDYRRAYFGKAANSMNGYDFYHVAVAVVPGENVILETNEPEG
jgi:methyltransferase (TIGR00027 family)